MKWTRETSDERYDRLTDWHEWFAWRPIRLSSTNQTSQQLVETREIIWCETVMRKYDHHANRTYATKEDALLDKLTENKNKKTTQASIHKMFQRDNDE